MRIATLISLFVLLRLNLLAFEVSVVGPAVVLVNPSNISLAPTTYYYSIMNGVYETNIWSHTGHSSPTCGCNPGCSVPSNSIIYISHVVTSNCSTLDLGSNVTFVVEAGGSFDLSGNGSITGSGSIQVDNGAIMSVHGDVTLNGAGSATINGTLDVYGSLNDLNGGGSVCGSSGTINVAGTISAGSVCSTYGGTLPIEMTSFKGNYVNKNLVRLEWQTITETNNKYFSVQSSDNGIDFTEITKLAGAGNSNMLRTYLYDDGNVNGTPIYYRLKQVDNDGNYSVSNTILVENRSTNFDIKVFPNPTSGEVNLSIPAGLNNVGEASLKIVDLVGKVILESEVIYSGTELNLSFELPHGYYNLSIVIGETKLDKPVIVH